ncbi:hypothetical protein PybrP1_007060 [[Pythium] brassicae (nom. inval.)]|nr:hypothetical protein PybrP1_007060 [[Pythium] brassicae (nom. inval.)]
MKRVSTSIDDLATKRRRDAAHTAEIPVEFFATHGYAVFPNLLSSEALAALRSESALLYEAQSDQAVVDQGCVLDVMADCPIREDAAARVDVRAYLEARETQFYARCRAARPTALQTSDVIETLVFQTLPSVAAKLMRSKSDATTRRRVSGAALNDQLYFFNEHYVVKPPRSAVEFRWHQDDAEQLAMCVHRAAVPPYVSAWCALDDVTTANGPLRFVSQSRLNGVASTWGDSDEEVDSIPCAALDAVASGPIVASAGTVVFFLSDVWHCSSSNGSDAVRRAFYAQYSPVRITASASDPWPLSFAIPCLLPRPAEHQGSSTTARRNMVPLRLRNPSEFASPRAQQQYAPFRSTEFSPRSGGDGPGALFREEWNSMAVNTQKNKAVSLYRTERDVNPTVAATVQRFYDAHEAHDLAAQLKHKGNAVTMLKSATPRFRAIGDSAGPGAYAPEKVRSDSSGQPSGQGPSC